VGASEGDLQDVARLHRHRRPADLRAVVSQVGCFLPGDFGFLQAKIAEGVGLTV